jgi:hypothetical protein
MGTYPPEVTQRFHGTAEQQAKALVGDPPKRWDTIVLEDDDPAWPQRFEEAAAAIRETLESLAKNDVIDEIFARIFA